MLKRLIERKRNGHALDAAEWRDLVFRYARDEVPDYQMAALCMAVFFRGLEPHELRGLTDAMLGSGGRLEFASNHVRVDKHSTGGVGDKVSLVLAPLVASCGGYVPMMSGRGLGHTGGTLDKLESIPGFRTDLSLEQAVRQTDRIGCAMLGQTPEIAPADRKLYALRDVTATVASIPLIAASIMSKKLAEGIAGLVLDVKRGSGAFLTDDKDSLTLARTMIGLGESRGCTTVALLTAMDRPLGNACGNAIEVEEAMDVLRGDGPDDVRDVTLALGSEMLLLGGVCSERDTALSVLADALKSGKAAEKFGQIIEAQGGNPRVVDDSTLLPQPLVQRPFTASHIGYVERIEPREIGQTIVAMGGGRQALGDVLDHTAGIRFSVKPGDHVEAGQLLAVVCAATDEALTHGVSGLERAISVGPKKPEMLPLISHRVSDAGVEEFT